MTGFYDKKPGQQPGPEHPHDHPLPEHDHPHPHDHDHDHTHDNFGHGHNSARDVVWERWQRKRTFVRALEGTYSDLTKELLDQPRVYSSKNVPWKGGPQLWGKHIISPQASRVTQSIETHI